MLNGIRDYSNANSVRSRGVETSYDLVEGKVYEINAPHSWAKTKRYFAVVKDGVLETIDAATARKMVVPNA